MSIHNKFDDAETSYAMVNNTLIKQLIPSRGLIIRELDFSKKFIYGEL